MDDMVNINRLLKLLPDFFRHASAVAVELCQNASRAGASRVDVRFRGNVMRVKDNGHGAEMAAPLLVLADSGWGEKAMLQAPAGFGCYFLYAISKRVSMRSKFGQIVIDCARFFDDAMYRQSVLSTVDRSKIEEGMVITAVLKDDVVDDVRRGWKNLLEYFPINVTVDGQAGEKSTVKDVLSGKHIIKTVYFGNAVYIDPFKFSGDELNDKDALARDTMTIWYGTIVHSPSNPACAISVTEGTPLTPVLPLRDGLKQDEKLEDFRAFVREKVISYLTAIMNDSGAEKNDLESTVKILAGGATQEELDNLSRWSVTRTYAFNDSTRHYLDDNRRMIVVSKGDVLESEDVNVLISDNGGEFEKVDTDTLVLVEGLFTEIFPQRRFPGWLKIQNIQRTIKVTAVERYSRYFTWYEAYIECDGKDIQTLAMVDYAWEGKVYFTPGHASDGFGKIQGDVFRMRVHSEDSESDSWDSQESDYNDEIEEDLQHLTGRYSLDEIFKSVARIANVRQADIINIAVKRGSVVLSLKRGKSKTLKLAV